MIYKCLYDPTIKSWMTENTDIVSIYNADSLDELCYLIQEDLILDSVIYDIFYCYIEENR